MAKSPLTSMQMGQLFGITQPIEYTETTVEIFGWGLLQVTPRSI